MLRRLPRAAAAPRPLPARRAAECFPAAIFFLYAGSLAGVLASLPVQLLTGGEQVNPVASYAMNGPLPLRILVMVVLALPFAYLHFRSGGLAAYVFGGVMAGISFFLLNIVFGYAGTLQNWSPWLTAAAPGLIYTAASLAAFGWLVLRR